MEISKEISENQSSIKSVVRDKFCWHCRDIGTNLDCSKCFRTFHDKCIKSRSYSNGNYAIENLICTICTVLKTSKAKRLGSQQDLMLLKHTMNRIMSVSNFTMFKNLSAWKQVPKYIDRIVNPIDLNEIENKIKRQQYDSFMAFIIDIACLLHNCYVYFQDHNQFIEIAQNLFNFCTFEIECISSCSNCYGNKSIQLDDWRVIACQRPHLILWAKLSKTLDFWPVKKGFTHWPAKLTSVVGDKIKVIFFGHTEFLKIPTTNCYIFSTQITNSLNREADQHLIEDALKEVDAYKKNAELCFGRMKIDLPCTDLNHLAIDNHLSAMFLDYKRCTKRPSPTSKIKDTGIQEKKLKLPDQTVLSDRNVFNGQTMNQKYVIPRKLEKQVQDPNRAGKDVDIEKPVLNTNTVNCEPKFLKPIIKTHDSFSKNFEKTEWNMWQQVSESLKTIESNVDKLNDVCNTKSEEVLELKMTKKSQSVLMVNYRTKLKILEQQLEEKCSKQCKEVSEANDITLAKLKKDHADEIMSLKKTHKKLVSDEKRKLRFVKENCEARIKKIKTRHDDDIIKLKKDLRDDFEKDLLKLKLLNETEFDEEIYKIEVEAEKQSFIAEIECLKLKHFIKIVDMEQMMKTIIEEKNAIESQLKSKNSDISEILCDDE